VHFGTEAYWEEQARDLEDLLDVMRLEDGASPAREEAAPAGEKYFWDMD
jgi:hypothetical protein